MNDSNEWARMVELERKSSKVEADKSTSLGRFILIALAIFSLAMLAFWITAKLQ